MNHSYLRFLHLKKQEEMAENSSSSETTILPDLQLYKPKAREDLSAGDLNESLANKIDLHMCNRETSILESLAPPKKKFSKTQKYDKVNYYMVEHF